MKNTKAFYNITVFIIILGLMPLCCSAKSAYAKATGFRTVKFQPEEYCDLPYARLSTNYNQFNLTPLTSSPAIITTGFGFTFPVPGGTFQTQTVTFMRPRTEMAIGYLWRELRAEAEFLMNSKMETVTRGTLNPVVLAGDLIIPPSPLSGPVSVQIENQTYLANLYYDLLLSERIRPFITLGLGLSINKLGLRSSNGIDITALSKRTTNLAYAGGLGLRVRLFSYCFVTASYRYLGLGKMETKTSEIILNPFVPVLPPVSFSGDLNQHAMSVGIMYFF